MNSLKRPLLPLWFLRALLAVLATVASAGADSDPARVAAQSKKPLPWPDGIVPYDPVGKNFDRIIGQWTDNGISTTDGEKLRLVYGSVENRDRK